MAVLVKISLPSSLILLSLLLWSVRLSVVGVGAVELLGVGSGMGAVIVVVETGYRYFRVEANTPKINNSQAPSIDDCLACWSRSRRCSVGNKYLLSSCLIN